MLDILFERAMQSLKCVGFYFEWNCSLAPKKAKGLRLLCFNLAQNMQKIAHKMQRKAHTMQIVAHNMQKEAHNIQRNSQYERFSSHYVEKNSQYAEVIVVEKKIWFKLTRHTQSIAVVSWLLAIRVPTALEYFGVAC